MSKKSIYQKFIEKVSKTPNCWIWKGAMRGGECEYGNIRFGKKRKLAHRLSWEIYYGKIPKGKLILHKCDNPRCVNPKHLFMGTQLDNVKDRVRKNRSAIGKNHGFYLHPESIARGENASHTKLTTKQVLEIRRKYIPRKYGLVKLAKEYGVTMGSIYPIIKRTNWTHI